MSRFGVPSVWPPEALPQPPGVQTGRHLLEAWSLCCSQGRWMLEALSPAWMVQAGSQGLHDTAPQQVGMHGGGGAFIWRVKSNTHIPFLYL